MSENTNPVQPAATVVTPTVPVAPPALPIRTSHVAALIGITAMQLRRHLRTLEGGYDDGKHTNYEWASLDCPEVIRIVTYVSNRLAARRPVTPAPAAQPVAAPVAPAAPAPAQPTGRRINR